MTYLPFPRAPKQTMLRSFVSAAALLPAIALLPMQAAAQFNLQSRMHPSQATRSSLRMRTRGTGGACT
jgi:hypothetical protein